MATALRHTQAKSGDIKKPPPASMVQMHAKIIKNMRFGRHDLQTQMNQAGENYKKTLFA